MEVGAMNVVSIMAHADDEMRCLGTMLKCSARGDRLSFITLTDGSKGFVQNPGIAREEAARIRYCEMASLAAEAAASYINLGEPDEFLYDTPEVRLKLIEAIRQVRADLVFTHYSEDYNQDHITVNRLVRHCAMQSCLPVLPTQSAPLGEHPAVFMCEPHGVFNFFPSHYVDISAFHTEKIRLLLNHVSQEAAMQAALGSGLEAICVRLEAYRGEQAGCQWAECFVPMPGRGSIKPFAVLP
jgi:LmbE family N-acetylglucosaminyl deacetylase